MKSIRLYLLSTIGMICFSLISFSQQRASDMISFTTDQHNFGKIKQGIPVVHDFIFTNKLNKPVIIENVLTSCGCTTPEWDKSPIAPGKSSAVKVGYNAAAGGNFNKSIQVSVKDANVPYMLRISGEVVEATTAEPTRTPPASNHK